MEPAEGSVEQAQQRILEKWGVTEPPEEPKAEQAEEVEEVAEPQEIEAAPEEPPAETAGEVETEEVETEEVEVSTLADLAEAIEVDQDYLYNIKVPFTDPSGQRGDFTLSEIKDSFQEWSKIKDEKTRFEQDRKTFEQERQQVLSRLNERLGEADNVLQGLEAQLDAELSTPEMEALRRDDPAEWTAKRQEIDDRKRQLQKQREKLKTNAQKTQEEQNQELEIQRAERIRIEAQKLLEVIPEWKDAEKAKSEIQQLVGYLNGIGVTSEEIQRNEDARLFVLARKAWLYDLGEQKVNVAKKKVKKLPRLIKPSQPPPKKDAEEEAAQRRRERLRKTGSVYDAAAVIQDRLFRR